MVQGNCDRFGERLDRIQTEFRIADRDALVAIIGRAMRACAENSDATPDFRERDGLDEFAKTLGTAVELLRDPLNSNRLALYWRTLPAADRALAPSHIPDFLRQLEFVQQAAEKAHRNREQKRGPLPRRDLRAAVAILVAYWEGILGRRFTQDQNWAKAKMGRREPITEGESFIYRAMETFAPDLLDGLRTVCRDFTQSRRRAYRVPSENAQTP
jgi:hypothetical protein